MALAGAPVLYNTWPTPKALALVCTTHVTDSLGACGPTCVAIGRTYLVLGAKGPVVLGRGQDWLLSGELLVEIANVCFTSLFGKKRGD